MAFAVARIAKLKGGNVSSSEGHNLRKRETPNADRERTRENLLLIGDGRPLKQLVNEEIALNGGKPRTDSVECVEHVLTASPEFFLNKKEERDQQKVKAFMEKCLEFIRLRSRPR